MSTLQRGGMVRRGFALCAAALLSGCQGGAPHQGTLVVSQQEAAGNAATNAATSTATSTATGETASESARVAAQDAAPAPSQAAAVWVDLGSGVRVDRAAKVLEVRGTVAIDVHGETPRVFLEVLVCSRDTKEHEALVVTEAKASLIHAGLLAIGLTPGKPGSWDFVQNKLVGAPPTGAPVRVRVRREGAVDGPADLASWVVDARDGSRMDAIAKGFVFAGSEFRRARAGKGGDAGGEVYSADMDGTIVGLATFGSECVAWSSVFSPEAEVATPCWIADAERLPKFGTSVVVTMSAE